MSDPHLWARPLQPEFAGDFFRLHDRSDCGGCWCMYWHFEGSSEDWGSADKAALRAAKEARIGAEGDTGMLLYEDQEPVGWCQFGPRSRFPKLLALRRPPEGPADLWCINCFLVVPGKRRQGYARVLLAVSLEHLQRLGVKEVEAYPKAGEHPDGEVWTGPLRVFVDAGFREIPGTSVVRKSI